MRAKEFMDFFTKQIELDSPAFVRNMENLNVDRPLHVWAVMLIDWMELGREEDARRYYEGYYDDVVNL